MLSVLQCPVCREPLVQSPGGYQCFNKHTFDAARQGYINLLLSHKKRSKEPGDSPELIQSRRKFLNRGFYDRLSLGLNQVLASSLFGLDLKGNVSILDAGCGEGFFLKNLKSFVAEQN